MSVLFGLAATNKSLQGIAWTPLGTRVKVFGLRGFLYAIEAKRVKKGARSKRTIDIHRPTKGLCFLYRGSLRLTQKDSRRRAAGWHKAGTAPSLSAGVLPVMCQDGSCGRTVHVAPGTYPKDSSHYRMG